MSAFDAYIRLAGTIEGSIRCDEPMSRHTSYRIGGPAALYIQADSLADLSLAVEVLEEEHVAWRVFGKGTNPLVADEGYDGAVVVLGGQFARIESSASARSVDGADAEGAEDDALSAGRDAEGSSGEDEAATRSIIAGAAVQLSMLVQQAYGNGLSGLEFAVGIPGSFGGAVAMNAGTRDTWMSSVLESVTTFESGRGLKRYAVDELSWGYRTSSFAAGEVVVEASVRLRSADNMLMRARMEAARKRRLKTQPINEASCGSVFRNPEGASSGKLIESCGLAGCTYGGAQISEKHANFIVNTGTAKARDVLALIQLAQRRVKETHGIELKPELRFLGFTS